MNDQIFESEFSKFFEEQKRSASGQRLERINKISYGEKLLMKQTVWPVFKSFEGFSLEYEVVTSTGIRIYIDAFYHPLLWAMESEGFAVHAGNITRERFSFERERIRTFARFGFKFLPFSWDELEHKPELCQRILYEMIGRNTSNFERLFNQLTVNEREVLRFAMRIPRPFRLADVCFCLQSGEDKSRNVIRNLIAKQLIRPTGRGNQRFHEFQLEEHAWQLF